jgi:hypothetical protein
MDRTPECSLISSCTYSKKEFMEMSVIFLNDRRNRERNKRRNEGTNGGIDGGIAGNDRRRERQREIYGNPKFQGLPNLRISDDRTA